MDRSLVQGKQDRFRAGDRCGSTPLLATEMLRVVKGNEFADRTPLSGGAPDVSRQARIHVSFGLVADVSLRTRRLDG
jgi:hypothetical protein